MTSSIFVLNLSAAARREVGAHTNVFAIQYMYVTGDFGSALPTPQLGVERNRYQEIMLERDILHLSLEQVPV